MAEEKGLIVEEQGGFRKKRWCRDQLLSLVLLGQTEMVRKPAGMLVAFIDFAKAYDKVNLREVVVLSAECGREWQVSKVSTGSV